MDTKKNKKSTKEWFQIFKLKLMIINILIDHKDSFFWTISPY